MLLTTYDRVVRFLGVNTEDGVSTQEQARIGSWIQSVSSKIEAYINTSIAITTYSETHDWHYNSCTLAPYNTPVSAVAQLYYDETSTFSTDTQTEITDYAIVNHGTQIKINSPVPVGAATVYIEYDAGLANTPATLRVVMVGDASDLVVNSFAVCDQTKALGIVRAASAFDVLIEVMYGEFCLTNSIAFYRTEVDNKYSTNSIASITETPLCLSNPDIVSAAEMEIRFMYDRQYSLEHSDNNKEGVSYQTATLLRNSSYDLLPQTRSMLEQYKRWVL